MKLSSRLLLFRLRPLLNVTAQSHWDLCPPLGRPLLYAPGPEPEAGVLYLTDQSDEALCRKGVCCIYAGGAEPLKPGGCTLCVSEDLLQAMNALQRLFAFFEDWQEQIERLVLEKGSVQQLLQLSAPVLENPAMVIGADFSLLAQVGEEQIPAELRLFDRNADSMEIVNALKQDEIFNQPREPGVPFLFPAHILGWRSWNVSIRQENRPDCRLMLAEQQRPLNDSDADLLEFLVPFAAHLLEQTWNALHPTNRLRSLFHRILTDRTADYLEMSRQLAGLRWEPEDEYLCLVLQETFHDQQTYTADPICNHLERQYCCCSFPLRDNIVTFFNLTREPKDRDALFGEMKYFIRESYLKAGYSRILTGHSNLRRQYLQAAAALRVGCRLRPEQWIHQFNSVAFPYLLEQATRQMPGEMVCHEKLLALRRHDETQNTQYIKTLRTYLDSNLNAVQTARQLYIHRSTLLYRLDRIRDLLESNLDDPEELLYLSISLRLLEEDQ